MVVHGLELRLLKEKMLKLDTQGGKFFTIVTAKSWDRQPKDTARPPLWALSAELGKLIRSQH